MKALDELESMREPDMLVRLSTIFTLAALSRELPLENDIFERVRLAYEHMEPTSGLQLQYFKLTRVIGWIEALRGDELAAFRYFRTAAELAPAPHWRVLCMTDRAYLAGTTGERAFAMDQLYGAHEQARAISWNDAQQEDRMTLLNLAELFAAVDPAIAQRYLALFRSLRTPMDTRMLFASDPRVPALEAYSAGMALLRLGEVEAARTSLTQAWETFRDFGYGWRAALCALGLHKATREHTLAGAGAYAGSALAAKLGCAGSAPGARGSNKRARPRCGLPRAAPRARSVTARQSATRRLRGLSNEVPTRSAITSLKYSKCSARVRAAN